MRDHTARRIGWAGILVGLLSALIALSGVAASLGFALIAVLILEPTVSVILAAAVSILAAIAVACCWRRETLPNTTIVVVDGWKPDSRLAYRYSANIRWVSVAFLVIGLAAVVWSLVVFQDTPFPLVNVVASYVRRSDFVGFDSRVRAPASPAFDLGDSLHVRQFARDSEMASIAVSKRPWLPWAQVTAVRAVTQDMQPLPEGAWQMKSSDIPNPPAVYIVELVPKGVDGGTAHAVYMLTTFDSDELATAIEQPHELRSTATITLENRPVAVVVKVNARKPGVYDYRLDMDVSFGWRTQRITAVPSRTVAFYPLQRRTKETSMEEAQ